MATRKEKIIGLAEHAVAMMSYYDRKGDEELTADDFTEAFANGEVTVDEVVNAFRAALTRDAGVSLCCSMF
jgi:hypothetical protein